MNIFPLHENPEISATMHSNTHVSSQLKEAIQMLSTNIWLFHFNDIDRRDFAACYNLSIPTHDNHPCTIWARESQENFAWLYEYAKALAYEYSYRTDKIHGAIAKLKVIEYLIPRYDNVALTPFAQVMPDQYKCDSAILAYRDYHRHEKQGYYKKNGTFVQYKWTERDIPDYML